MSEKSFVKNCADPEQVKSAKFKEKFGKQNDRNDLLWVLSDIRGRRFLWKWLKPVFELSFTAGMSDVTVFNEGNRNKANQLLKEVLDAKPEAFITMMREAEAGDETQGDKEND